MKLRNYQQDSVDAVYSFLSESDGNPCVVIPTGGGKTPVLSTICKDVVTRWGGRVLILSHVKELLQQAADKLNIICPDINAGIYSAGLKSRDTENDVIIAGIQSVYKRACDLGAFDIVIVDECHLIPPSGEGMYLQFLRDAVKINPKTRIVGLTATPYRLSDGLICGPDNILTDICYEIGVKELIEQGFLCPLTSKNGKDKPDTSKLHKRGGEFITEEMQNLMDADAVVQAACADIAEKTANRNKTLIFCCGVNHAQHVQQVLMDEQDIECGFVCGETPATERDELIEEFKSGYLNYLVNVNVLTIGFDAPNIDCIVLLRPTDSPGLFYQMVGRGFRIDPTKNDCLVLDYGGNVDRHGPVDQIRIDDKGKSSGSETGEPQVKECPECQSLFPYGVRECADCGYQFTDDSAPSHDTTSSDAGILSNQYADNLYEVTDTTYKVHEKKGHKPGDLTTMCVTYKTGLWDTNREWLCFEHKGVARKKAEYWWTHRSSEPIPDTTAQAVQMAESGVLAKTEKIIVRSDPTEKFDKIISYEIGEIPEPGTAWAMNIPFDDIEVPF